MRSTWQTCLTILLLFAIGCASDAALELPDEPAPPPTKDPESIQETAPAPDRAATP